MTRRRTLLIWNASRRYVQQAPRRITQVMLSLLCALVLGAGFTALLGSQPARAASHPAFYGIPSARMQAAAGTDTPTPTPSDTATPTATPGATATPSPTNTPTPAPTATPTGTPSTVLDVSAAVVAAGWPQQYSNWCGVATVALIANYLGVSISQSAILGMLNNPANASQWSYPPPAPSYYGPYVPANISGDFGTDPRALAQGLTLATGHFYHAKVDTNSAWDATIHIVRDLLTSRQPISVFVDHGQHSVIVSGVEATDDPIKNPGSITAIHVWDPGGGINYVGIQPHLEEVVPLNAWLSGIIPWSGSDYFKYPYAANVYQGKALDPDPAVGPYAFVPSAYNHLWIGHYVYLSPLASGAAAGLNADWELNQNGVLIAGLPSSPWPYLPDGYADATVPMPTNPPPPPPPVQPPKPAPKLPPPPPPKPTPTARPKPTATPLATATALPTVAPVVTRDPAPACAPVGCALTAIQADWRLLTISLLLALLTALWFPAVVLVARVHTRRVAAAQAEKETLLAMLPGVAESDNPATPAPDAATSDVSEAATAVDTPIITDTTDALEVPKVPEVPETSGD